MAESIDFILGFDPGGRKHFGWSVCRTNGTALSPPSPQERGCADNAQEAFEAVQERLVKLSGKETGNLKVLAAGIDSPLRWGQQGNRAVDEAIRKALRKQVPCSKERAKVLAVNSLWGSVLVQGVLLGKYLRDEYKPEIQITETHPKALLQLLKGEDDGTQLENLIQGIEDEHERDATISAFAAWKMRRKADGWKDIYKWNSDLGDPLFGVPYSYWMPIKPFDID